MNFALFALAIAAAFLASSLILLNFGRHLGLRYLQQQKDAANMAGLATVEGAVFALIGLLLAFTISGALQRFDERRQLVVQEANAASTAHDRLGLFEGEFGRNLQAKLKDYVEARIDLYRMPHDFSLWRQSELFLPNSRTRSSTSKTKFGTRRPQPAHRQAFGQLVRRPCQGSRVYSKSLDCGSAPAKNIRRR